MRSFKVGAEKVRVDAEAGKGWGGVIGWGAGLTRDETQAFPLPF